MKWSFSFIKTFFSWNWKKSYLCQKTGCGYSWLWNGFTQCGRKSWRIRWIIISRRGTMTIIWWWRLLWWFGSWRRSWWSAGSWTCFDLATIAVTKLQSSSWGQGGNDWSSIWWVQARFVIPNNIVWLDRLISSIGKGIFPELSEITYNWRRFLAISGW